MQTCDFDELTGLDILGSNLQTESFGRVTLDLGHCIVDAVADNHLGSSCWMIGMGSLWGVELDSDEKAGNGSF